MFTIVAGAAGVVKRTRNQQEAEQVYRACRDESASGTGPFAYQRVELLDGDRVAREFVGTVPPEAY